MKFLNALNKIQGVGPQKMKMLLDFFETPENVWNANLADLKKSGIQEKLAEKIFEEKTKINPDEEMEKLKKENISIITLSDDNYPKLLKEIPNPPYILYVKGSDFDFNARPMVAVVGSRKFTQYGSQVATSFSRDLARSGIAVVSGMALGIDAIAHSGALEAGGKTFAVLGSSLEDANIGPRTNFELSRKIMDSGALISEFPLGIASTPQNFPARNRIMAGMSLGTLVVEAAEDSGSIITANLALEFNREVFAVPGSIFSPVSTGVHKLIKSGAKMATSVKDILEELRVEEKANFEKAKSTIPATSEEEKILKLLSHEPLHIDKLAKMSKLETSLASSTLMILEIKGMVKNIGGQNYIIL
jgi:DNA processing protein